MKKPTIFHRFIRLILIVAAAVWMLFEEWVWNSILAAMERLGRLRIVRRFESFLKEQNQYVLLSLFVLPFLIMLPAKLFGLYLIANGKVFRGVSIFLTAKVVITALVTRLFVISREKLLLIKSFALFYYWFIAKKEWLYAEVRKLPAWRKAKDIIVRLKRRVKRTFRLITE